jgi:beta-aspartyl-peptidase (threonine type)
MLERIWKKGMEEDFLMFRTLLASTLLILTAAHTSIAQSTGSSSITMVIHGGAGTIRRDRMSAEQEKQYREKLEESLRAGHKILAGGGSSLDAVEAAVRILEDSPLFNAGKGSVFTAEGRNEMDASIMNGRTRAAGAVASVTILKNPISAARAVMEKSENVLMTGRGAELFATKAGLETVDPSYFWTERRWRELQQDLLKQQQKQSAAARSLPSGDTMFGTVGAVAVDNQGNLAAATSTGGRTAKMPGRVGDSPVIAAGTFADNETCAVSATGHGEYFIRWAVAYDISALMRYRGMTVQQAAEEVVNRKLKAVKGEGGVIALDAKGSFSMPFNTDGMYRGYIRADGVPQVLIFRD